MRWLTDLMNISEDKMKNKNTVLKRVYRKIRTSVDFMVPSESIKASKEKWSILGREKSKYYIFSDNGKSISEKEFRESGEVDYKTLVLDDPILRENIKAHNNVLEIGCGTGRVTEFFAGDFKHVYAADISRSMIEQARERLAKFPNIELIETNGFEYPIVSNAVDLVFSYIVFQHMPNKEIIEKNLCEIGRILRVGGIAKIQFRGVRVTKDNWFYGADVRPKEIKKMAARANLHIIDELDNNQKYYWVWFQK